MAEGVGAASGVATVTGVGISTHTGTGVSAGVATISGIGVATNEGEIVGFASGIATALGIGTNEDIANGILKIAFSIKRLTITIKVQNG